MQHMAQMSNLSQFNIWQRIQYLESKNDAKPRHIVYSWPTPANMMGAQRTLIPSCLGVDQGVLQPHSSASWRTEPGVLTI